MESFGSYDDVEAHLDSLDPDNPTRRLPERPNHEPEAGWSEVRVQKRERRQLRQEKNRARAREAAKESRMLVESSERVAPVIPLSAMDTTIWSWAKAVQEQRRVLPDKANEEDLEESFVRGSGKGGQKVNRTASCVMLKHLPTGLQVRCEASRSQWRNRQLARENINQKIQRAIQAGQRERSAEAKPQNNVPGEA